MCLASPPLTQVRRAIDAYATKRTIPNEVEAREARRAAVAAAEEAATSDVSAPAALSEGPSAAGEAPAEGEMSATSEGPSAGEAVYRETAISVYREMLRLKRAREEAHEQELNGWQLSLVRRKGPGQSGAMDMTAVELASGKKIHSLVGLQRHLGLTEALVAAAAAPVPAPTPCGSEGTGSSVGESARGDDAPGADAPRPGGGRGDAARRLWGTAECRERWQRALREGPRAGSAGLSIAIHALHVHCATFGGVLVAERSKSRTKLDERDAFYHAAAFAVAPSSRGGRRLSKQARTK